jgi:hypothetical protein
MRRLLELLIVVVLLGVVLPVGADIVKFDDLPALYDYIPSGYQGFTWSTWFAYLDAVDYSNNPSGYLAGMVSAKNVALNSGAEDVAVSSANPFDFEGAYFTGAWNDDLNIDISGWLGGSNVHSTTVIVSSTAPTWVNLNWANVDELRFHSYGGTPNPDYSGYGEEFAMDNFTYEAVAVPAPSALILAGIGLSYAGWRLKRKTV